MRALVATLVVTLGSLLAPGLARGQEGAPEPPRGLRNESEFGLVLARGNADATSFNLRQLSAYRMGRDEVKATGRYVRVSTDGVDTAENYQAGLRYDRFLSDDFTVLAAAAGEGDPFAGIRQRYNLDAGAKRYLSRVDGFTWYVEGGYRRTRENRTTGESLDSNYVRLFTQAERELSKTASARLWVEGLPNLTDTENYQINTEASVQAVLNSVFSIKTAYLVRYNNFPPAGVVRKTDTALTTALVAKF
jgi:putative salt-induced outer membrane protein